MSGKDTLNVKQGIWRRYNDLCDEAIPHEDKVRYIGEPVAAVAAITEEIAEKALDLIEVDLGGLACGLRASRRDKEGHPRDPPGLRAQHQRHAPHRVGRRGRGLRRGRGGRVHQGRLVPLRRTGPHVHGDPLRGVELHPRQEADHLPLQPVPATTCRASWRASSA